jgi:hypothetical protein
LAANVGGINNVAVGLSALFSNNSGASNTAVGTYSLYYNTSGLCNTAAGLQSLYCNTTGCFNTATGVYALCANTTGTYNTATGFCALSANNGDNNTAVGYFALGSSTGGANTAVGVNALCQATGITNTAIGLNAGTAITGGNGNVVLGVNSGSDALCTLTTQSNNVIIGNNGTTVIYGKVAFTNASDVRWKKIDGEVALALPFVQALTPIKYQFCDPETGEVTDDRYRYGFSAQEVIANEEIPEHPIIARIDNEEMYSLNETQFIPVLVNAIKELATAHEALAAENADLKSRLDALESAGGA